MMNGVHPNKFRPDPHDFTSRIHLERKQPCCAAPDSFSQKTGLGSCCMDDRIHWHRADGPARILYAPVAGGKGTGELRRCEALIEAVDHISPCSAQALVGPIEPRVAGVRWFPLQTSPTRSPAAIVNAMNQFRPDWIVLDGNTRQAPLKWAARRGVRTVFIASRPRGRRKSMSPRRLPWLDWIWLVDPVPNRCALRWHEPSILKFFSRTSVRVWSSLHALPDPVAARRRLCSLGIEPGQYLLLCAGGGGQSIHGRRVGDLMREAAVMASGQSGWPALVVGVEAERDGHVLSLPTLAQSELVALIGQSRACLVGGGSILAQALIEGANCAAVGWQSEQCERVSRLAQGGFLVPGEAVTTSMATALVKAACDESERTRLRLACQAASFSNGINEAVSILLSGGPASGRRHSSRMPAMHG